MLFALFNFLGLRNNKKRIFFSKLSIMFTLAMIILYSLFVTGCSSSENFKKTRNLNLSVKPAMIDVWINLMPGTDKPKLHVLGEANVKNLSNRPVKNLIIRSIEINQDGKSLYNFPPNFDQQNVTGSIDFLPGEIRLYAFSTKAGLGVSDNLIINNPVNLIIEFSSGSGIYFARIDSVKIKRVY